MLSVKQIDVRQAKAWLDTGEAALLDVREPQEYQVAHIHGAIHVPLGKVCGAALPNIPQKKLIVHCKLGKRSEMACEKLRVENPALDLYNIQGGIDAWQEAGLPVVAGQVKQKMSVDRQIQVTVGAAVLVGVLGGYFLSPLFFSLAIFFGAGLLYSGLKGSCMMAMLFTRLPWNK